MPRLLPESELLEIYRQTIHPLYAYVSRRVGGDRPLAEDLVQDTWTRALRAWPASGTPDDPLRWLIKVAHNVLVSHFRRVQPDLVDPAVLDLAHAAAHAADSPDAAAMIGWGLARLKDSDAEILEAFYFDGKSTADVARERSVSERAVEGRLHRARAALRKRLDRIVGPAPRKVRTGA